MRGLIASCLVLMLATTRHVHAAERDAGAFADETLSALQARLGAMRRSIVEIASAAPDLPVGFGNVLYALNDRSGGHWAYALFAGIVGILFAAIVTVYATRSLLAGLRAESVGRGGERPGPVAGLIALGLDLLDRVAVAVVAGIGAELLLTATDASSRLGFAIIFAGALWWIVMLLAEVLLRPRAAGLRLVAIDDDAALLLWRLAGCVVAIMIAINKLLPLLIEFGLSVPHAQAVVLLLGSAVAGLVAALLRRVGVRGAQALRSFRMLIAILWLALVIGVLRVDLTIVDSAVLTLLVLTIAFAIDRLIGLGSDAGSDGRVQQVIRRCTRFAAAMIVLGLLAETWAVGQLELLSPSQWREASRAMFTGLVTLFIGYVAWEAVRHWIDSKIAGAAPMVGPGSDDGAIAASTRFTTLLPLFRTLGAIAIFVLASLVALSEWGVNIAPLLAGASIFGLAISFGSQALVRDIVSGIFFIADDAFRIGEYIDTGKLKGTVEAITIRSVKLRHQNGQVHTIPFGQLLSVTNFSRDWSTVKFNLRLARDSDIEKVRKAIKRIGQEMQDDDEIGPEMIEPLKLQGVADIVDNALVIRLKFTARPVKPNWVQREALKRIHNRFPELGIEFASNAVTVHTAELANGGAAALASAARPAASPDA